MTEVKGSGRTRKAPAATAVSRKRVAGVMVVHRGPVQRISRPFDGGKPAAFPVSRAKSHETIAPFAPPYGADVERTGLNVFAVSGCVLAVFVRGDHGRYWDGLAVRLARDTSD
jgi:hypothetical protein